MGLFTPITGAFNLASELNVLGPLMGFLGQAANHYAPYSIPKPADILRAWRNGYTPTHRALAMIRANGVGLVEGQLGHQEDPVRQPEVWNPWSSAWAEVMNTQVEMPAVGELLTLLNREHITREQYDEAMKLQGWWWRDYRNWMVWLSKNQAPGPAELVSFALREAWDPATVNRFEYDAEFPAQFQFWMTRQGAGGAADAPDQDGRMSEGVTWPKLYWRVHWQNISPTQAYEMFQRLREGRWQRYAEGLPGLRAFTAADLADVLKINDYPRPFRPQLAAVAFHKPRLVDIDRFYTSGQIGEREVYELHLDLGYSPPDARMRTNWLVATSKAQGIRPLKGMMVKGVVELYQLGILSSEQAALQLVTPQLEGMPAADRWNQLEEDAQLRAVRVGALTPQQAADAGGLVTGQIERAILAAKRYLVQHDLVRQVQEAKATLRGIARRYLAGQLDRETARGQLLQAGVQPNRVQGYLDAWSRQLGSGRIFASTALIRKWVVRGVLPLSVAEQWLRNLGWPAVQLPYLMAELRQDVDLEELRVQERQARTERSREAALMRQAQVSDRARQRAIRALNRQASPAALKRYFVRGIIGPAELEQELTRRGFTDEAVKRQVRDAVIARRIYLASKSARAALAGDVPAGQEEGAPPPTGPTPEGPGGPVPAGPLPGAAPNP